MTLNLQAHLRPTACDVRTIDVLRAKLNPDAAALRFDGHDVLYCELTKLVSSLGALLRKIQPDGYVAICMANGLEPAVAYLACLRFGIKFAIINPELNTDTLAKTLALVSPGLILTDATTYFSRDLASFNRFLVILDGLDVPDQTANLEWVDTDTDQEAVLVFSSGSTGLPKGICHSYSTLNALIHHSCLAYPSGIDLFSVPMAGLGGLQMLLTALATGKSVLVLPSSKPDLIVNAVKNSSPERVLLFPAIIAKLVADSSPKDAWVDKIKECHSGGDRISIGLIKDFHDLTGIVIQHAYGMAEFGIILRSSGQLGGHVTFGTLPTSNIKLSLLTDRKEIAQPGKIGQLHIEATSLMKGYRLISPLLDAGPIIPPQIPFPTDDYFRSECDGTYVYVGRASDLIKFRDSYVSMQEVEELLRVETQNNNIVLFRSGSGELTLCVQASSRVLREHEQEAFEKAAKVALERELRPKHIFFLDQLPLSTTGKIDRQAIIQLLS